MNTLTQTENRIGQLLQTKRFTEEISMELADSIYSLRQFGFGAITYNYLYNLAQRNHAQKKAQRKASQKQIRYAHRMENWIKSHGFRVERNTSRLTEQITPILTHGDGTRELDTDAHGISKLLPHRFMTRWIQLVEPSRAIHYEPIAEQKHILPFADSLSEWLDAMPTPRTGSSWTQTCKVIRPDFEYMYPIIYNQ